MHSAECVKHQHSFRGTSVGRFQLRGILNLDGTGTVLCTVLCTYLVTYLVTYLARYCARYCARNLDGTDPGPETVPRRYRVVPVDICGTTQRNPMQNPARSTGNFVRAILSKTSRKLILKQSGSPNSKCRGIQKVDKSTLVFLIFIYPYYH